MGSEGLNDCGGEEVSSNNSSDIGEEEEEEEDSCGAFDDEDAGEEDEGFYSDDDVLPLDQVLALCTMVYTESDSATQTNLPVGWESAAEVEERINVKFKSRNGHTVSEDGNGVIVTCGYSDCKVKITLGRNAEGRVLLSNLNRHYSRLHSLEATTAQVNNNSSHFMLFNPHIEHIFFLSAACAAKYRQQLRQHHHPYHHWHRDPRQVRAARGCAAVGPLTAARAHRIPAPRPTTRPSSPPGRMCTRSWRSTARASSTACSLTSPDGTGTPSSSPRWRNLRRP